MRTFSLLAVLGGLFVVVGCADSATETTKADAPEAETFGAEATVTVANEVCPIMGEAVKKDGGTADWNGKTIGFCCPECVEKWEALSDDEKAAKMTGANPAKGSDGA